MAGRHQAGCHTDGDRGSLHRPLLHFASHAGHPRIYALGDRLRFAVPPFGAAVHDDDGLTAAARAATAGDILQKTYFQDPFPRAHLVGTLQHVPLVHGGARAAGKHHRGFLLLHAGARIAGAGRLAQRRGDDPVPVQLQGESHVVHVFADRALPLYAVLLGMGRKGDPERDAGLPGDLVRLALPALHVRIHSPLFRGRVPVRRKHLERIRAVLLFRGVQRVPAAGALHEERQRLEHGKDTCDQRHTIRSRILHHLHRICRGSGRG